jgi:DNA-binding winged helix-turn-helix (wHTH) protein/TolB-like protein
VWPLSESVRYFKWLSILDGRYELEGILFCKKSIFLTELCFVRPITGVAAAVNRSHSRGVVRFGVFEADLRAGELHKDGIRIRLQEQPFQVLSVLLRSPGELVTREQLREEVWPQDTFVEFDHALNTAIKKIRAALCDDAATPRYIETIPKRGYRWIAPLRTPWEQPDPAAPPALPTTAEQPVQRVNARTLSSRWMLVAGFLLLGLLILAGFRFISARRSSSTSLVVAVLPFQNWSDDPGDARTCRGMTADVIGQLAALRLARVQIAPDAAMIEFERSPKPPTEIGRGVGADLILLGNLRSTARHVRLSVELIRVRDNARLWGDSFDHAPGDSLDVEQDLARQVATSVRTALLAATP